MTRFLRSILRRVPTMVLVAAIVASLAAVVTACPTCKQALANGDPHHERMVAGYFYSILFMMSMPFLVLGTFGSFAYLSIRRARNAVEEESADDRPTTLAE